MSNKQSLKQLYVKIVISIITLIIVLIGYLKMPKNNNAATQTSLWKNKALKITRHAKERMLCRHIDSFEIREIINQSNINYSKSDTTQNPCRQKYALEGITSDRQNLRIIIAPCKDDLVIITVIDIKNDYDCN